MSSAIGVDRASLAWEQIAISGRSESCTVGFCAVARERDGAPFRSDHAVAAAFGLETESASLFDNAVVLEQCLAVGHQSRDLVEWFTG